MFKLECPSCEELIDANIEKHLSDMDTFICSNCRSERRGRDEYAL